MRTPKVSSVSAEPQLMANRVEWEPLGFSTPLDHYRIEGHSGSGWTLLGKTIFPFFVHDRLDPQGEKWKYRVIVVDAAGNASGPSRPVRAASLRSATTGTKLAALGEFDLRASEFQFAPQGYEKIAEAYPDGEISIGADATANDVPYLLPGPKDKWGGEKSYTLHWDFDVADKHISRANMVLALWVIDTTKLGGTLELKVNDFTTSLELPQGGTAGSKHDDARTITALKPAAFEIPLPDGTLASGHNTLTATLAEGSWLAWDAVGFFTV